MADAVDIRQMWWWRRGGGEEEHVAGSRTRSEVHVKVADPIIAKLQPYNSRPLRHTASKWSNDLKRVDVGREGFDNRHLNTMHLHSNQMYSKRSSLGRSDNDRDSPLRGLEETEVAKRTHSCCFHIICC